MSDSGKGTEHQAAAILKNDGSPYPSEASARLQMHNKKLQDTHHVTPYTDGEVQGFAITEKPAETTPPAAPPATPPAPTTPPAPAEPEPIVSVLCPVCGRLSPDPRKPDGPLLMFGDPCDGELIKHNQRIACQGRMGEDPSNRPPEKYFWCTFTIKGNDNDFEDVTLGCNGEILVLQRGVAVPLPERFIIVAENALKQRFKKEPHKPRKVLAPTQMFPFSKGDEATKEDFDRMKREGAERMRSLLVGAPGAE